MTVIRLARTGSSNRMVPPSGSGPAQVSVPACTRTRAGRDTGAAAAVVSRTPVTACSAGRVIVTVGCRSAGPAIQVDAGSPSTAAPGRTRGSVACTEDAAAVSGLSRSSALVSAADGRSRTVAASR